MRLLTLGLFGFVIIFFSACVPSVGRHSAKLDNGFHPGLNAGLLTALPKTDQPTVTTDDQGNGVTLSTDTSQYRPYIDGFLQRDWLFKNKMGFSARIASGLGGLLGRSGSPLPVLDLYLQLPSTEKFFAGVGVNTLVYWGPYLIATYYPVSNFFVTLSGEYDVEADEDPSTRYKVVQGKLSVGYELKDQSRVAYWISYMNYLTGSVNLAPNTCFDFSGWGDNVCPGYAADRRSKMIISGFSYQF